MSEKTASKSSQEAGTVPKLPPLCGKLVGIRESLPVFVVIDHHQPNHRVRPVLAEECEVDCQSPQYVRPDHLVMPLRAQGYHWFQ